MLLNAGGQLKNELDTHLTTRVKDRLRLRALHARKIRCIKKESLPKGPTTERLLISSASDVLENASDGMRVADIARQINQERSYERGDGQPLPAYQVSSIAHANRDRFRIADGVIALQTQGTASPPAGRRD